MNENIKIAFFIKIFKLNLLLAFIHLCWLHIACQYRAFWVVIKHFC